KKVNRKQLGAFGNNSLMTKLLELIRSLYQIHKSSLNSSENDRFEQVFSTTLMCMKSVLRLTYFYTRFIKKNLKETFNYFKSTFNVYKR
ncbi:unnamed protein product, partial [Rotaria sordida]